MIDLVNNKKRWLTEAVGVVPDNFSAYLNPVLGINYYRYRVGNPHGRGNLPDKIIEPGGVDNIYLVIAPFGMHRGGKYGHFPLFFNFMIVGHRVFALYRTAPVDQPGFEKHGFYKGGLTTFMGANKGYVFYVFIIKIAHGIILL